MARVAVLSLLLAVLILALIQPSSAVPTRARRSNGRCKAKSSPSSSSVAPAQVSHALGTSPSPQPPAPAPPPVSQASNPTPAPEKPKPTTKTPEPAPEPQPTPTPSPEPKPAPAPAPVKSSPSSDPAPASSDSTSNSDIQAYLSAHNTIRAQHGAAPLTWSDNLAAKAQQWANNCVFKHSGGSLGPFGENLAAGTGSSYGISEAVKSWTDEVSEYNANDPQPSHFTQVVWKGSTQVGCAVQSCSGIFAASFGAAKFYVCEYSPQGNIIGQFAQNVQV